MALTDNVFRGPRSVAQYFDPESNPPLPLVEIPDRLNPFKKDNVRIYAKMLTCLPAQNVKSLPALQMLRMEPKAQDRKIAEASSGSTILSLGIIARVLWDNNEIDAHMTNKKPLESLNLLRFFGIRPCLYAGFAQQEPTDPTGIMARLRRRAAESDDMVYLGQYDNANNWKAHAEWTGPQILRQLPEINVFCTTVGTGGCMAGTGFYLKSEKSSTRVIGVFNALGDPTPGPRYFDGFQSSAFPWQETIDSRIDVTSASAYRMSMRLSREGLICGPSSGEALQGLLQYLAEIKRTGRLEELIDEDTKEISCVFTCSDLPYQYLPGYFEKLDVDEFPRIENEILLQCDQNKHDPRWILDAEQAVRLLYSSASRKAEHTHTVMPIPSELSSSTDSLAKPAFKKSRKGTITRGLRWLSCWHALSRTHRERLGVEPPQASYQQIPQSTSALVIDLRNSKDFETCHVPGSVSLPLSGLHPGLANGDLFGDAEAVHMVWTSMQKWLRDAGISQILSDAARQRRKILLLCYDGFASQLGSSTLRKEELEAFSAQGGFQVLWASIQNEAKLRLF